MAQDLLEEFSSPHEQHERVPAHRRQLLQVAQELKDRLRFRCVVLCDRPPDFVLGSSASQVLVFAVSCMGNTTNTTRRFSNTVNQASGIVLQWLRSSGIASTSGRPHAPVQQLGTPAFCFPCIQIRYVMYVLTPHHWFCSKLYSKLHTLEHPQIELLTESTQQGAGVDQSQDSCNGCDLRYNSFAR